MILGDVMGLLEADASADTVVARELYDGQADMNLWTK